MTWYTIRIELHDVAPSRSIAVYDDLHARLEKIGVVRKIASNAHGTVRLPTGLYYLISEIDEPTKALDFVRPVVQASNHRFEMFVAKTTDWAADNLQSANS